MIGLARGECGGKLNSGRVDADPHVGVRKGYPLERPLHVEPLRKLDHGVDEGTVTKTLGHNRAKQSST